MFKKFFGFGKTKEKEEIKASEEAEAAAEEAEAEEAEAEEAEAEEAEAEEAEAEEEEAEEEEEEEAEAEEAEAEEAEAEEAEAAEAGAEEAEAEEAGAEEAETEEAETEEAEEKLGFFAKLKKGLANTTKSFTSKIETLFSGYSKVDDEIFDELEELLILADLGFDTAMEISEKLRRRAHENKIEDVKVLENELQNIIEEILVSASEPESDMPEEFPQIMVIVGVNGVGKTTSIGKLAMQFKNEGKSVVLAAGDTFRAAAADQLSIWADRALVPIIRSNEGADPSSVIFDAIKSAKSKNTDVLICDTAGRLHNKKNLMNELEKIFRIINREYPEAKKEILLVIDATTGQNAINQAKTFSEVAPLTGIILTKLDGTAKGGVVIGLSRELKIPIKYVGIGEKIEDLQKFNARDFAAALFSRN